MNALAVIDNETNVEAYRASTNAASLCKDIVVATASTIQGRKYVAVEGWMAIAVAHGCAAGARDVERVEGGVRAIGEVRRMSDGQIIATAEGFVGEDEPTWFGGDNGRGRTLPKRADYAIRAMAQTRAISRACRSAFAHVVVMMNAGLATTPAEEVPHGGFDDGAAAPPAPVQAKVTGIMKIKEAVRQMKARGNEATDLAAFNGIVGEYEEQCNALCDNQHEWWTGRDRDGNEFESIPAWINRRRSELTPDESADDLILSMKECDTRRSFDNWLIANMDDIEQLDGAAARKFQLARDFHESGIDAVATVTA